MDIGISLWLWVKIAIFQFLIKYRVKNSGFLLDKDILQHFVKCCNSGLREVLKFKTLRREEIQHFVKCCNSGVCKVLEFTTSVSAEIQHFVSTS